VRSKVIPERFDVSMPENQRKLEAAEKLAEQAGLSVVQLAIGFILAHRALTAAIVGPRKLEHLDGYLAAADVYLEARAGGARRPFPSPPLVR
jgi:aryl-alcohol dehydrogenase-like predicted oxidoreductase